MASRSAARTVVSPFDPEPREATRSPASRLQYGAVVSGTITWVHSKPFAQSLMQANDVPPDHSRDIVGLAPQQARMPNQAERLSAIINTTVDGIIVIDG